VVTTTESLTAGPDLSGIRASTRGIKPTPSYRVFTAINIVVLCLVGAITLYPFLNLLARSFSSESAIRSGEVFVWPVGFNTTTLLSVIDQKLFWINYGNTVVYTVVATVIAMVLTTTFAYVLSKTHLKGRGLLVGLALFTMFFSGGLIPNYMLIVELGFKNTIWAIVLPQAINVFNLLIMKRPQRSTASRPTASSCGSCCRSAARCSPPWCSSTRSRSGTRGSRPSSTWTSPSSTRSRSSCATSSRARPEPVRASRTQPSRSAPT
jgi:hypothetical protein